MLLNMEPDSPLSAFSLFGPTLPQRAVIFSAPHGGRYYPPRLLAASRVPRRALERLEDRHVDGLVEGLEAEGWSGIIARWARAWIDLNRSENDIDAGMVAGRPMQFFPQPSEKVRGGLGLFPRRLAAPGELWRGRFDWSDLQGRVEAIHRPYHRAITLLLDHAQEQYGAALLLDVHSMPSLSGVAPAQIVIGDRHGLSAPSWLSALALQFCREAGFRVALNRPYAGGYVVERHARPAQQRYALQIEIDRALYLDDAGDLIKARARKITNMLDIIARHAEARLQQDGAYPFPDAAE